MNIATAQQDMRYGYHRGATGLLVSGLVWLSAGLVAVFESPRAAVVTLLFGGMLIFPASVLLSKALGRPGTHSPDNPLGALALEGTVFFLLGIVLAVVVWNYRMEWFFPAMLLLIGGRYLTFATLYGMRMYWICGAALAIAGFLLVAIDAPTLLGPFTGGVIELLFAAFVASKAAGDQPNPAAATP